MEDTCILHFSRLPNLVTHKHNKTHFSFFQWQNTKYLSTEQESAIQTELITQETKQHMLGFVSFLGFFNQVQACGNVLSCC